MKKKYRSKHETVHRLKDSHGRECCRNIVRFIYYTNYAGNLKSLQDVLLRDLPKQMSEFYNIVGFQPSPLKASEPFLRNN